MEKEEPKKDDLTTEDGNISLRKFRDREEATLRWLNVLVDGSGMGIAKDDPRVFNITSQMCHEQAMYSLNTIGKIWSGAEKYMRIFYKDESEAGTFDFEKMCRAAKESAELQQIIGMITILASIMNVANKEGKKFPIYLEHPETHLHPKRQSAFVSFMMQITKDYGWDAESEEFDKKSVDDL